MIDGLRTTERGDCGVEVAMLIVGLLTFCCVPFVCRFAHNNSIDGTVPAEFAQLTNLRFL